MDNERQQIGIAFECALIHVGRFVRYTAKVWCCSLQVACLVRSALPLLQACVYGAVVGNPVKRKELAFTYTTPAVFLYQVRKYRRPATVYVSSLRLTLELPSVSKGWC